MRRVALVWLLISVVLSGCSGGEANKDGAGAPAPEAAPNGARPEVASAATTAPPAQMAPPRAATAAASSEPASPNGVSEPLPSEPQLEFVQLPPGSRLVDQTRIAPNTPGVSKLAIARVKVLLPGGGMLRLYQMRDGTFTQVVPPDFATNAPASLPQPTTLATPSISPATAPLPPPAVPRSVRVADLPIAEPDALITLVGEVDRYTIGGSGRYVLLSFKTLRKVGVFDLRDGRVLKYVDVEGDRFSVAGGATQFVVVDHANKKLDAWRYDSLEQPRLQAKLPVDAKKKIVDAVMGASSEGPLGLVYSYQELEHESSRLGLKRAFVELVDTATLKPPVYALDWKGRTPITYQTQDTEKIVVSDDGRSFTKVHSSNIDTLTFNGTSLTLEPKRTLKVDGATLRPVSVGFDGTLFDKRRILLPEGRIFGLESSGPWLKPTYPGRYWMITSGATSSSGNTSVIDFYLAGYTDPIATLRLPTPQGLVSYQLTANAAWTSHNQIFCNTDEKALVAFLHDRRNMLFKRFDVGAEVAKSKQNILTVTSKPPQEFVPGKKLEYRIQTLSNRGGVAFRLASGPKGMTVSHDGKIEWTPAADEAAQQTVLVELGDAAGTQVAHNIKLARVEAPLPVATVGDKIPVDPNAPRSVVRLPASAEGFVPGAGGRYLLAVMPSKRQIAVIDVKERKIAKLLPADDDVVKVAAGATKFVVYSGKGTLTRWNFDKLERELSVPIKDDLESICMGCAAEGPLLLSLIRVKEVGEGGRKEVRKDYLRELYELDTLQPSKTTVHPSAYDYDPPVGSETAASADGRTFVSWHCEAVPPLTKSLMISGNQLVSHTWIGSAGPVTPSPDGSTLHTVRGECSSRDKEKSTFFRFYPRRNPQRITLPASTGSFALAWPAGNNVAGDPRYVTLHVQGDQNPILTIPDVEPPGYVSEIENDPLFSRRLMYVPDASAIVSLGPLLDSVTVRRFVLEEELAKTTNDYLFVTSLPPQALRQSTKVNYQLDVKSKKGGLHFKITAGPPEAGISPTGLFTWRSPSSLDGEHPVSIVISDSAGNSTTHSFVLRVEKNADEVKPTGLAAASTTKAVLIDVGRPRTVVELPGPIERLCVGGAGRYLVGVIPTLKRVAVIDVVERKILNFVSADDDKVRVAAGATTFVVSLGTKGTLSRYALPSCERELTVVAPPQEIIDLEMGCNSEGPVYALSKGTSGSLPIYFDLKNLKPFAIKEDNRNYRAYGYDLACSADGRFFSSGTVQAQLVGDRVQFIPNERRDGYTEGTVLPSADGRVVYGYGGMWKVGGERVGDDEYKAYHIPAAGSPLFARITATRVRAKPADPTLHLQGQNQPLLTIDDVDVAETPNPAKSRYPIRYYADRFFLLPISGAICTLDSSAANLSIYRFQLDEELLKTASDYLFVASMPPVRVHPDSSLSYQLDVRSKRGGVRFRLETGPPETTISPSGLISWSAKGNDAAEKIVVVAVSDASGQELFHTFRVQIDASAPNAPAVGTTVPKLDVSASSPAVAVGPKPGAVPAADDSAAVPGQRAKHTLRLPAVIDDVCVGGGGRYLVLTIGTLRLAVIFDVAARKVVKYLSIDDDRFQITAGDTKFIVAMQSKNILTRYDLATGERELDVPLTGEGVAAIALGSSSEGPLFTGTLSGSELVPTFRDLRTLEPIKIRRELLDVARFGNHIRVSADGTLFASWLNGSTGLNLATLRGISFGYASVSGFSGPILPSPDALNAYNGANVYSLSGRLLNTHPARGSAAGQSLPAASGPLYLRLAFSASADRMDLFAKISLMLHAQGETAPIIAIGGIELPKIERDPSSSRIAQLKLDRRLFLLPVADAIAAVSPSGDAIETYRFQLDEELRKSEVDYLFVASVPPAAVKAGTMFEYRMEAKSKRGGVKYRLESGPAGMTVSPEGLVAWKAAMGEGTEVTTTIALTDSSGQESFYTFHFRVDAAEKPPEVKATGS